jgi:hypothetical protein
MLSVNAFADYSTWMGQALRSRGESQNGQRPLIHAPAASSLIAPPRKRYATGCRFAALLLDVETADHASIWWFRQTMLAGNARRMRESKGPPEGGPRKLVDYTTREGALLKRGCKRFPWSIYLYLKSLGAKRHCGYSLNDQDNITLRACSEATSYDDKDSRKPTGAQCEGVDRKRVVGRSIARE